MRTPAALLATLHAAAAGFAHWLPGVRLHLATVPARRQLPPRVGSHGFARQALPLACRVTGVLLLAGFAGFLLHIGSGELGAASAAGAIATAMVAAAALTPAPARRRSHFLVHAGGEQRDPAPAGRAVARLRQGPCPRPVARQRAWHAIGLAALLLPLQACLPARATEPPSQPLDGQSFDGTIRATGLLGLFSRRGTLSFRDGLLDWRTRGDADHGAYPPAPYTLAGAGEVLEFRARITGRDGDHVDWSGRYHDGALLDVHAAWTRARGDFVHDLLLPEVVTLAFIPD